MGSDNQVLRAPVHVTNCDGIAILTIDNPPVNALGAAVRDALAACLDQAMADPGIRGIVLRGANGRFVAGADIKEFGKPTAGTPFHDIIARMENGGKIVVAVIEGFALGGGLELALGAHCRIATATARLGLPEIKLGLIPGGGGTQRTTRLIGPQAALDLMLTGDQIPAQRALELGLIDSIVEGNPLEAGIGLAITAAAQSAQRVLVKDRSDKVAGTDPQMFAERKTANARKWQGTLAPFKLIECVEAACTMDGDSGLAFEREAFAECRAHPARAAQTHLFFAERQAAKVADIAKDTQPADIAHVGIVGAGTMGGGIAMAVANAGLQVTLVDASQQGLEAGMDKIRKNYAISRERGSRSQAEVDAALGLITPTLRYTDVSACDLIIEAVFENIDLKKTVLAQLDAVAKAGAVLATNTSALDIDAIAAATSRPSDVIGMHFFSPANVMRLCENIRGKASSDRTIATAMRFAQMIGKVPVLAGNCPGFIGNRILRVYRAECDRMLEEGATPWQIDAALKAFGFPMGIYLMLDLGGLDVVFQSRQGMIRSGMVDPTSPDYTPLLDRLFEAGRFGQKVGKGYYTYVGREGAPDPAIDQLLGEIAKAKAIARRPFSDAEIIDRVVLAIVNEACWIIEQGFAQRPSDIDVVYVAGYGFPAYRGGPMFWAAQQGWDPILARIEAFHAELGKRWRPAPFLEHQAREATRPESSQN
ncbi:3-hydroxyacyl-CoA dehydrogenase NAD-binding domain-containing protein [Novosphingobium sp. BL-52-GroH]|uniref:3-hydroxyacyl-CoA dehydrogenase NAD-binding domain-containing protein n=1 Tax=Novosphingobium sp. BL-52-GroH TaxID=3349877 RepID=UPI00384F08BE